MYRGLGTRKGRPTTWMWVNYDSFQVLQQHHPRQKKHQLKSWSKKWFLHSTQMWINRIASVNSFRYLIQEKKTNDETRNFKYILLHIIHSNVLSLGVTMIGQPRLWMSRQTAARNENGLSLENMIKKELFLSDEGENSQLERMDRKRKLKRRDNTVRNEFPSQDAQKNVFFFF